MSFFSTNNTSTAAANSVGDLKQDVQINNPPEDSISDLAFNPNPADAKDFLAVSSWDKKVRIYEIQPSGQGEGRHAYDHNAPVFSVDFHKVGIADPILAHGWIAKVNHRMVERLSPAAQTRKPSCATSPPCKRHK
jgi:WD40 repeat protein